MTDVVIAGAGPVGLWLASELRLRGVDVVVLEQRTEVSPHSKAFTIHPRTIELLAQRGASAELLERARRVPSGHFGALDHRLDFSSLDTPYPYTLLFPQAETERLLESRARALGADIRRGHRLVNLTAASEGMAVTVVASDGDYTIECAYVAGCDGGSSSVRQSAGIAFVGTDTTLHGFLGDVHLADPPSGPLPPTGIRGLVMIVPLATGEYRIVGIDPERQSPPDRALGFDEFRESVRSIAGSDFGMHSPSWLSRYGNATRLAERYVQGRVLLAGDAAHTHFPAGGVGMNAGIQDAHALGWRLADVVHGFASPQILNDYHRERHEVGVELARSTQAQTALMAAFTPDSQALRGLLTTLVAEVPALSQMLAERLAGLAVVYPAPAADAPAHPATGRRLAPQTIGAGRDADRAGRALLLDPGDRHAALEPALAARDIFRVVGPPPLQIDATVLVRPDGHVRWAEHDPDDEATLHAVDDFRSPSGHTIGVSA